MAMTAILPYALSFRNRQSYDFRGRGADVPDLQTNGNTDVATLGLMVGLCSYDDLGCRLVILTWNQTAESRISALFSFI